MLCRSNEKESRASHWLEVSGQHVAFSLAKKTKTSIYTALDSCGGVIIQFVISSKGIICIYV